MTVNELKNREDYEFECNLFKGTTNVTVGINNDIQNWDEWGCAELWLGEKIGVEYNFCIDDGEDYSAIYKMEFNEDTGYMETDGDSFVHYVINFDEHKWIESLENAMYEALIKFFEL